MKLGVISDTHDRMDCATQGIDILNKNRVAAIIHCGDWTSYKTAQRLVEHCAAFRIPIFGVFGNNDSELIGTHENRLGISISEDLVLELPEGWVGVTHGDDKLILQKMIDYGSFAAVFTGHTHVPLVEKVGNTLVVNPGPAGGRRRGGGGGYSVAVYDTKKKTARIIAYEED